MPQAKLIKTRSVFIITVLVLILATTVGGLGAHVVSTMRRSADQMDDQRAIRAAEAAVLSMKIRMSGTVRDNAVWDDAYTAITKGDAATWVYENWGKPSEDYPLYDGVALTGSDGSSVSAFWKGKPFNPEEALDPHYLEQVKRAAQLAADPLVNFVRRGDDIVLMASQAVQPYGMPSADPSDFVLSYLKSLNVEVISFMAREYQLDGLALYGEPQPALLNVPLADLNGKPVAYLSWPTKAPGSAAFASVYGYAIAFAVLLGVFMIAVVAAGGAEARRLHKLAAHLRRQATQDSLTGLVNRFGLLEELERRLASPSRRSPLVLHMLDLDGFKLVNDAWGHAVGDRLLVLVAEKLSTCHPEVAVVARIGGDEFALIQLGPSDPALVARSVMDELRKPFQISGRTIEIGATIGSAGEDGLKDPHELLRRADIALYQGKDGGRRRHVAYHPDLDRKRESVAALEAKLREAIRLGDIVPFFQPLACASTGALRGVEALARWGGSTGGVGPDIFIPLAEKSGLIDALGLQVLRKSVQAAKAWPDFTVSVNVSPIQLCNPDFARDVLGLLRQEGFDAKRLVLEITEGVLITNPDQAKRAIDALKAEGIRFALDDFGCGYASIGALREFGFDRMKIDRSLVLAADRDREGVEVLRATISLAAALGIPVTAEGIETGRQAEVLREAGCDQLQGFLVGKPMSEEELSRLVRKAGQAA